ncbi:hypothetical protein N6L24_11355 [Cognatishimia sp. SS12]|nr:hypothetical protein [Cognatishimia sp. SS12]MDC0738876.1 hypothetical protein [Cognatishimia sp. SS12]
MTNPIAIFLGGCIAVALIADQYFLDGSGALLAARKFADLIEWVAFWR